MNIIVKSGNDRDPFQMSDRLPAGSNGGKGDFNRSMSRAFVDRFPGNMGPKQPEVRGLSKCCKVPVRVMGRTTHWYECGKCGKAVDL